MDPIFYLLLFLFFLFVGSFLGVVTDRIYRGEQFVKGRSYCEFCKHLLNTLDLIPLFSYLWLRGRCRYCNSKISSTLPVFEFITASFLTATVYWVNEFTYPSLFIQANFNFPSPIIYLILNIVAVLISISLLLVFFTDIKYMVIPDIYLIALAVLVPSYLFLFEFEPSWAINLGLIKNHLVAAGVLALFFAIIHFGSGKKAMGEGDIYLAAILGLYLGGYNSIVMWFVAFLTGAVVGVILMLVGKKRFKSMVPFGPFLIVGFVTALLLGTDLLNFYFSI